MIKQVLVSEDALNTLKAMAEQMQTELDAMRDALKPFAAFAKHYPLEGGRGNRPSSGTFYAVASHDIGEDEITIEDFHRALAAMQTK